MKSFLTSLTIIVRSINKPVARSQQMNSKPASSGKKKKMLLMTCAQ